MKHWLVWLQPLNEHVHVHVYQSTRFSTGFLDNSCSASQEDHKDNNMHEQPNVDPSLKGFTTAQRLVSLSVLLW